MAESTPEASATASVDAVGELLAAAVGLDRSAAEAGVELTDAAASDAGADPVASLPAHAQKLLRIGVPIAVTLAAQRKSVREIVELGPGAIIKFEKTFDEPLELCVGGQPIATGEVVKVGDKFGLRVRQLGKCGVRR